MKTLNRKNSLILDTWESSVKFHLKKILKILWHFLSIIESYIPFILFIIELKSKCVYQSIVETDVQVF